MQSEDQYVERTPDLVAKIRAMREAAKTEMNRFTRVADYDVRRVVGQKPRATPVSPTSERPKKSAAKSATAQTSIQFAPAPAELGDDGENA
jgi:hypothetical protein